MTPRAQLDLRGLHVLDGGMATELERKGFDLSGPLWSAHVLENEPQAIVDVHRDYLEAGADCLLTASYQVSQEGFSQLGQGPKEATQSADAALRRAVELAERARDEYASRSTRKIWIAASLGPYGAMLHNGAEYHGNYDCSPEDLEHFHSRRIAVLAETDADFLAFESVPSLPEARAILTALQEFPQLAAYISFTCRDAAHVSHGESLKECAALLEARPQIIGIGVNCTSPRLISGLIAEIRQASSKTILVYPNSGEGWNATDRCWQGSGDSANFGPLAKAWRDGGAQWIGGCCRTGPEHIRAIAAAWGRR